MSRAPVVSLLALALAASPALGGCSDDGPTGKGRDYYEAIAPPRLCGLLSEDDVLALVAREAGGERDGGIATEQNQDGGLPTCVWVADGRVLGMKVIDFPNVSEGAVEDGGRVEREEVAGQEVFVQTSGGGENCAVLFPLGDDLYLGIDGTRPDEGPPCDLPRATGEQVWPMFADL